MQQLNLRTNRTREVRRVNLLQSAGDQGVIAVLRMQDELQNREAAGTCAKSLVVLAVDRGV